MIPFISFAKLVLCIRLANEKTEGCLFLFIVKPRLTLKVFGHTLLR